MDQTQQELRRAAAQAFMESLEQLEKSLTPLKDDSGKAAETVLPPVLPPPEFKEPPVAPKAMTVQELEAAAADIEQFIKEKEGH